MVPKSILIGPAYIFLSSSGDNSRWTSRAYLWDWGLAESNRLTGWFGSALNFTISSSYTFIGSYYSIGFTTYRGSFFILKSTSPAVPSFIKPNSNSRS